MSNTRTNALKSTSPSAFHDVEKAKLDVSRAAIALFIEHGTSRYTVKELATSLGVSERTFYRYFPTKEDVVKPAIADSMASIGIEMLQRPADEPLRESIVAAFSQAWVKVPMEQSKDLFKAMNETDSYRAVWLQAYSAGEAQWAQLIAQRLGIQPTSHRAILAGAVVTVAARMALENSSGTHPKSTFGHYLDLIGTSLFSVNSRDEITL